MELANTMSFPSMEVLEDLNVVISLVVKSKNIIKDVVQGNALF